MTQGRTELILGVPRDWRLEGREENGRGRESAGGRGQGKRVFLSGGGKQGAWRNQFPGWVPATGAYGFPQDRQLQGCAPADRCALVLSLPRPSRGSEDMCVLQYHPYYALGGT